MSFIGMVPTYGPEFKCKDCPQMICRVVNRNHTLFGHVINFNNGDGGVKGKDHICPNRFKLGSVYYEYLQKKLIRCVRCLARYTGIFINCPFCYKLKCQYDDCQTLRDCRYDKPQCPRCRRIMTVAGHVSKYDENLGKYVKCDWMPLRDDDKYLIFPNGNLIKVYA